MASTIYPPPPNHWVVALSPTCAFAQPVPSILETAPQPLMMARAPNWDTWLPTTTLIKDAIKVAAILVLPQNQGVSLFFCTHDSAFCLNIEFTVGETTFDATKETYYNPVFVEIDDSTATNHGIVPAYIAPLSKNTVILSLDDGCHYAKIEFRPHGWKATPKELKAIYEPITGYPMGTIISPALHHPSLVTTYDKHNAHATNTMWDRATIYFAYPTSTTSYEFKIRHIHIDVYTHKCSFLVDEPYKLTMQYGTDAPQPIQKLQAFYNPAHEKPLLALLYQDQVAILSTHYNAVTSIAKISAPIAIAIDAIDPSVINVVDSTGLVTPVPIHAPVFDLEKSREYTIKVRAQYSHAGTYTPFNLMSNTTLFHLPSNQFIMFPSTAHITLFDDTYFPPEKPEIGIIQHENPHFCLHAPPRPLEPEPEPEPDHHCCDSQEHHADPSDSLRGEASLPDLQTNDTIITIDDTSACCLVEDLPADAVPTTADDDDDCKCRNGDCATCHKYSV